VSGFAGFVHPGGGEVDPEALRRMADALAYRGPDGVAARVVGSAGLAHALLRTGPASSPQPATLDGETWVVADARLDARGELVRELRAAGRDVAGALPDAELLLHAWAAWGEALPERVLGDFSLALWDAPRRRLLLARDRFGVKLLYHARAGDALVFGNTLGVECQRCGAYNQTSMGHKYCAHVSCPIALREFKRRKRKRTSSLEKVYIPQKLAKASEPSL
jgi:asparagine synthase (glutamine-hydrolysing)